MFEVGRLCVKTCGRDASNYCVILEKLDEKYFLVDGNVRRKKVNMIHIEPLNKKFNVKKTSTKKDIFEIFKKEGIEIKMSEAPKKRNPKPQEKKVRNLPKDKKKVSKTQNKK